MKECSAEDWDAYTRRMDWRRVRVHDKLVSVVKETIGSGRILEVGAQTGLDAEHLADRGFEVTALDYTDESVRILKHRNNIQVVKGDGLRLPFRDSSFDLVYSQGLVEHFVKPALTVLVQEQFRAAKDYVIIDVPNTYSYFTPYKKLLIELGRWIVPWETEFTHKQLRKLGEENGGRFIRHYSWGFRRARKILLKIFGKDYVPFEERYGHYFQHCIGAVFEKSK